MAKMEFALTGNPNCGKTTVFNALTGANQSVGNWPGVTVEKKAGRIKKDKNIILQDLPGIYSLAPYTPEEIVARDYIMSQQLTAIIDIVDATNIQRNLYLTMQLLETGIPMVVTMNMMDVVAKQHIEFDLTKLAEGLGIPVIGICALKNVGLDQAIEQAVVSTKSTSKPIHYPCYGTLFETAIAKIEAQIHNIVPQSQRRWFAIKLFERDPLVLETSTLSTLQKAAIETIITTTESTLNDDSESIVVNERYEFITRLIEKVMIQEAGTEIHTSEKIDRVVTNRFLALPIFAFVMWAVYYLSIQTVGSVGTNWVNNVLFGEFVPNGLIPMLAHWQVADWMQSLIVTGIVSGVGSVLGFLPQLIVLFFCLGILEDCGYMARVAFVMDRLFRKFGLSGKSFIPMLVATGCGVPGIMASRTIENQKNRRMTIMVTTFMPCSAKLTIIALIAGAFFSDHSWVAPSAYFVGIFAIVCSGIFLKKTRLFSSEPAPFIMELPAYHFPQLLNVLRQVWERSRSFVKKAGTVILISCIVIWYLSNFNYKFQMVPESQSILAGIGSALAFLFLPLGFNNWRAVVAVITGLVAKENVVGTFGVLFSKSHHLAENGRQIWPLMRQAFTPAAGYAFLIFNLLCAPCFAAMGAIRREMGNIKWTFMAIGYQCTLAYVMSLIVYQLSHWLLEGGPFTISTMIGLVACFICGYGLFFYKPKVSSTAQFLKTVPSES